MRIDVMKASLAGSWLIGLGAIAVSDLTTSGSNRAMIVGCGVVLAVAMWRFGTAPQPTLSENIQRARQ